MMFRERPIHGSENRVFLIVNRVFDKINRDLKKEEHVLWMGVLGGRLSSINLGFFFITITFTKKVIYSFEKK